MFLEPGEFSFEVIAAIFNPAICQHYLGNICHARCCNEYSALTIQLQRILKFDMNTWMDELEEAEKMKAEEEEALLSTAPR